MLFEGRASNWALTKLEIENLGIEVDDDDDDDDDGDDDDDDGDDDDDDDDDMLHFVSNQSILKS